MSSRHYPSAEYRILESLRKYCNFTPDTRYPLGIGDDAAVRQCGRNERLVITGDTMVEEVDFSLAYMTLPEVGYKIMAANVSDCAAMGAVPDAALIQLVFPKPCPNIEKEIRALYRGFHRACRQWALPIIGGDLSGGTVWTIAVTLIGRVMGRDRVLKRTGAVAGDGLWVSGWPGSSAAGLAALRAWPRKRIPAEFSTVVDAHIAPQARVESGRLLAGCKSVHAMIDVSDGISKESRTLSFDNRLKIELAVEPSMAQPAMLQLAKALDVDWRTWFLHGGEDYELLFAAADNFDPGSIALPQPVFKIGQFKHGSGVFLRQTNGKFVNLPDGGYDHLA
jgi:thiamine-monophosphate kinase